MEELKYWLGFSLIKGIGSAKVRALQDHFGTLAAAWQAHEHELLRIGLGQSASDSLITSRTQLNLDQEWDKLQKQGV